jgi:hypothetical protein
VGLSHGVSAGFAVVVQGVSLGGGGGFPLEGGGGGAARQCVIIGPFVLQVIVMVSVVVVIGRGAYSVHVMVSVGVTVSVQVSIISDISIEDQTANSGCPFQCVCDRGASRNFLGIGTDREHDRVCGQNGSGIKRSGRLSLKTAVNGASLTCEEISLDLFGFLDGLALRK